MIAEKENKIPQYLAIMATLTALAYPIFYLVGFGYDYGYLGQYGLSNEFFPRSPQEYFFYSYVTIASTLASVVKSGYHRWYLLLTVSLMAIVLPILFVFLKNRNSLTRLNDVRNKIRSHRAFEYWFFPLVSWILSVLFPYFLFLTMVSLILLSGIGFSKGAEVARDEIRYYRECENSLPLTYGCSTLTENGRVVARGKIVARSGTHIAIFTRGITTVFPLESIVVEVHHAPLK